MQATKEAKRQERGREGQGSERPQQAASALDLSDEDDVGDPAKDIAYLQAAGWRKVPRGESQNPMKRWLDPQTGKPPRKELVVPELRDLAGRIEKEAVYQNVCGVPAWYYSRKEAVEIQRDRDEAKKKKGSR